MQWNLLSKLLDHCFRHVPYYQKLFAEFGLQRSDFASLEDISRVPILSKDVLRDFNEEFKSDNFLRCRPREKRTSGSTGTPLRVYWDLDSNVLELTCMWRHFSWAGYRLGELFLEVGSRVLDAPEGYKWNWNCRGLEIFSDNIDVTNIKRYTEILRKYHPKLWRGLPGAIDSLCRLLKEAHIRDLKPKYVITSGEPLLDNQRKLIESWTGVTVCESYGLMEHNAFICQCPQGGYHIASEYGLVEIIKDDGTPAQPGEEGRIIATGLHNKAFPLLRYDTGDYAISSDRMCNCGRTLPLVERITGRMDDRILNADGKWISGLYLSFDFASGLRMAQVIQEEPRSLDVYLVPSKDYSDETETFLHAELKKKLGESMKIRFHRVKQVPFRSAGKSKFIISRLKNKETN